MQSIYLASLTNTQPEISLSFLSELQSAHIQQYSFNNISVLLSEQLPLESDALFDKIVTRKRGGYCFEHNKLFYELLTGLGFTCELVLARVLNNRDIEVARTHRITKVTIEDIEYFVDVGFGPNCPLEPVLFRESEAQVQGNATYRIKALDRNEFQLELLKDKEWYTLYRFDEALYTDADCTVGHHFSHTHPKAVFKKNLVISLKNNSQLKMIINHEFTTVSASGTKTTTIKDRHYFDKLLTEEYGITLKEEDVNSIFANYCRKKTPLL